MPGDYSARAAALPAVVSPALATALPLATDLTPHHVDGVLSHNGLEFLTPWHLHGGSVADDGGIPAATDVGGQTCSEAGSKSSKSSVAVTNDTSARSSELDASGKHFSEFPPRDAERANPGPHLDTTARNHEQTRTSGSRFFLPSAVEVEKHQQARAPHQPPTAIVGGKDGVAGGERGDEMLSNLVQALSSAEVENETEQDSDRQRHPHGGPRQTTKSGGRNPAPYDDIPPWRHADKAVGRMEGKGGCPSKGLYGSKSKNFFAAKGFLPAKGPFQHQREFLSKDAFVSLSKDAFFSKEAFVSKDGFTPKGCPQTAANPKGINCMQAAYSEKKHTPQDVHEVPPWRQGDKRGPKRFEDLPPWRHADKAGGGGPGGRQGKNKGMLSVLHGDCPFSTGNNALGIREASDPFSLYYSRESTATFWEEDNRELCAHYYPSRPPVCWKGDGGRGKWPWYAKGKYASEKGKALEAGKSHETGKSVEHEEPQQERERKKQLQPSAWVADVNELPPWKHADRARDFSPGHKGGKLCTASWGTIGKGSYYDCASASPWAPGGPRLQAARFLQTNWEADCHLRPANESGALPAAGEAEVLPPPCKKAKVDHDAVSIVPGEGGESTPDCRHSHEVFADLENLFHSLEGAKLA
eukprot:g7039.t1